MDNSAVSSDANQVIAPSEPAQEYRTQSSQSATGITDSGMAPHSMSSLSAHSSTNDGNTMVATPARATCDLQTSDPKYMPLRTAPINDSERRPGMSPRVSSFRTEADLFRVLSRRLTN